MQASNGWSYSFERNVNCSQVEWVFDATFAFLVVLCIIGALNVLVLVCGLVLNSITLLVLRHLKEDSLVAPFFSALAVADFCFLISNAVDIWCHSVEIFHDVNPSIRWSVIYLHPVFWMLRSTFISIRSWSVVTLLVVRAVSVGFPFRVRRIFTPRSIVLLFFVLWVANFLINGLKMFEFTTEIANCSDGFQVHITNAGLLPKFFTWSTTLIFSALVPAGLCLLANSFFLVILRRSYRFRRASTSGREKYLNRSEYRRIRLVIIVSLIFVLCRLPMIFYAVMQNHKFMPQVLIMFVLIGGLVNNIESCCNFFIYKWTTESFKDALHSICHRKESGSSVINRHPETRI